ncbi:MAG: tetratricopeptide repeat protein [Elusimicrobia bacterium]|nr:tetratricopeptide repeat protein [Elusimicrobiota bacterium]
MTRLSISVSLLILISAHNLPAAAREEQPQPKPETAGQLQKPAAVSELPELPKEPAAAVEAPRPAAAVPVNVMWAEWEYLKKHGEDKDEDVGASVLEQLTGWQRLYADTEYGGDAQLLKADLHLKLGNYKAAIVDLLKHLYEYPESELNPAVRKLLTGTIDKKAGKKVKAALIEIAKPPGPADKAERLALLIKNLADQAGEELYEPLTGEFQEFFYRFPLYAKRDELQLALGNLYLAKEEYIPARLAYEKLIQVYPASRSLLAAKKSLADVLADKLKDYNAALNVYQDIAADFPGTPQAWLAYGQTARLSERQKRYDLAVETYEKIVALYQEGNAAYDALKSEAKVLRENLSKPKESIDVLNRLADKYKGEKAIAALNLAAETARRDLKDTETEIKMYDRITAEYPDDPQTPKAVFAAAQAYEKNQNLDKAREYCTKILEKYPDDPMAKKAQKSLNSLMGK